MTGAGTTGAPAVAAGAGETGMTPRNARCAAPAAVLAVLLGVPAHTVAMDSAPEPAAAEAAAVPQRDVYDVLSELLGRERSEPGISLEPKAGISVSILPTAGYNPSYGLYAGVSAAAGGWLGDPATTTLSSGSASATYSTSRQVSLQLKSDVFTPGNTFALKGDWRYLDTSQPTFGLGPATGEQVSYPMEFVLYRFYQAGYWHLPGTPMYAGVGYHFNHWTRITEGAAPGVTTPFREYSGGPVTDLTTSGVSVNVLYETRDNPINAQRGAYWNASFRSFLRGLGSDEDWQGLWSDLRFCPPWFRSPRNRLAVWNYAWFTFGPAPYFDLPAIGWDTYGRGGRGYLQGRIRGQNQIYTEFEYRFGITRDGLFGGVAFLNLMATTIPEGGNFGRLDPGGGVGLRVKYHKRTATNLAADVAWDQFGAVHAFFGMQEAF